MANKRNSGKYCPDIAIPPGETLLEVIESKGMTQVDLAERMGRPKKTINEIINGKAAITADTAIQLERVLDIPARFWNNLEMNYREDLARIAEQNRMQEQLEWIKSFPIKKMIDFKWIDEAPDKYVLLDNLLTFFGVASIDVWNNKWSKKICEAYNFRKSRKCRMDTFGLAAWLRRGELVSKKEVINKFDKRALYKSLHEIRALTIEPPDVFVPKLTKICSECGIAIVFIPELPNVPVHGVTRWASAEKVIIQLSLRYKSDDQLWFSVFHELGHVLKHGKRDFVYGEYTNEEESLWEQEADAFALENLISEDAYKYFCIKKLFTEASVTEFANSQQIAPGIVVGRLQHDKYILYSMLNHLKQKFEWSEPEMEGA